MKRLSNNLLVLILLPISIFSTAVPLIALDNQMLDGNVYDAILNGENDILTFLDGSFQSNLFAKRGYDKGKYTTVTKGNSIWFKAKTVSPDEVDLFWTGVIDGKTINGTYLFTKKGWFIFGDTTKKKNFRGSLKTN